MAAARELRDRYLEQVNGGRWLAAEGKYDVSRLPGEPVRQRTPALLCVGPAEATGAAA